MTLAEQKQQILNFIKRHTLAVVATTDQVGQPQAAVVEFSETNELEIIFDTFTTYRKYANLKRDPRVAAAIGWDEDVTVQYQGIARELTGEELHASQQIHTKKLPKAAKFLKLKETRYFRVRPTWIRYSDLRKNPWEKFEIIFDQTT